MVSSSPTTTANASTAAQTRLPLLPSDRRKKLQNRRKNSNKDHDQDEQEVQRMQKEEEESKIRPTQNDIMTDNTNDGQQSSSSIDLLLSGVKPGSRGGVAGLNTQYSVLPLPIPAPLPVEIPVQQQLHNDDDDEKIGTAILENNNIATAIASSNQTPVNKEKVKVKSNSNRNKVKEQDKHKKLREEQIQKFSSMSPLTASSTTNAVTHFMHTTIKFMNSIAAEVDSKLEHCENCMEELEIRLNFIEQKLDSTR